MRPRLPLQVVYIYLSSYIIGVFLIEEADDIIKKTHLDLNHAGRDKMQKEINRKYANITLNCINLYKSLCEECQNQSICKYGFFFAEITHLFSLLVFKFIRN